MQIYGLKNCDTCRKALKAIKKSELIDVRDNGINHDILLRAYDQFGGNLINKRSTTWRNLNDSERKLTFLELVDTHPSVMKRPLIVTPDAMYLGWNKDTADALGAPF